MSQFQYSIKTIAADKSITYDRVFENTVEQCQIKMEQPPGDGFYMALDKLVPFVVENHLLASEWEDAQVRRLTLFPEGNPIGFAVTIRLARPKGPALSVPSNKFVDAQAERAKDIIKDIIEKTIAYIETVASSKYKQGDLFDDDV